jgi:Family of unknown function (DUF6157)
MPLHTTNYRNTFIAIADDCPAIAGEIPPVNNDAKTIAARQFELISRHPYQFTSDDILFQVFADRNDLTKNEYKAAREVFFSKGQPCFRASPLTKRYGWGVHSNAEGKIALYGAETKEYAQWAGDKKITVLKAMRSGK